MIQPNELLSNMWINNKKHKTNISYDKNNKIENEEAPNIKLFINR